MLIQWRRPKLKIVVVSFFNTAIWCQKNGKFEWTLEPHNYGLVYVVFVILDCISYIRCITPEYNHVITTLCDLNALLDFYIILSIYSL